MPAEVLFVTDVDESLTKIVNGTEELWKKHHGCLRPIMMDMEYNIERHVKKYGPITQETMLRMLFMRVIFTHGKHDFFIKTYVKKLKDNREYIKALRCSHGAKCRKSPTGSSSL